ncbi:MAG: sigma-70 family RNA polymerase sigma factor [Prevotella sp.]|nr:sigma-70 family RNA polymerase sigma factor [Prevotella sp.]
MTQEEYKGEVQRLRPRLLLTARRFLSDDDAEDVVQDVLLRLWQMTDSLRMPIDALATVLVRNFCVDRLRRQRPAQALTAAYEQADDSETDERMERILAMIDTLPTMQQTILRLRHIEGMEMKEVAELTGSSEVAIRKALSRARQALRQQYQKRYE